MPANSSSDDVRTKQFVALLGRHERALLTYIFSLVADWNVSEDIAQETRLQLWLQFDKYDPRKDFGAWSRSIARYKVLQYRSRSSRNGLQFQDDVFEQVAETAAECSSSNSRRLAALAHCVEKLQAMQRHLLRRFYGARQTLREIAQEDTESYASIRQKLVRTRVSLRECVEKQLQAEGDA